MRTPAAPAILFLVLAAPAFAQPRAGKGQGAIVIHDGAPVYANSKGDKVEWKLKRGDAIAGYTANGILAPSYLLDEVDGRVHVLYFQGEQKGMTHTAWMDPKDLSRFTYDGSCQDRASPLAVKGFSQRWNACFEEARDTKLDLLRPAWEPSDRALTPALTPATSATPPPSPTPSP